MMYATETVLALHRARVAEERRIRMPREPRAERVETAAAVRPRFRMVAAN